MPVNSEMISTTGIFAALARVSAGMMAFWLIVCTSSRSNFWAIASSTCCDCRAGSKGLEKIVVVSPLGVAESVNALVHAPTYLSWVGPTSSAMRLPWADAMVGNNSVKAVSAASAARINVFMVFLRFLGFE